MIFICFYYIVNFLLWPDIIPTAVFLSACLEGDKVKMCPILCFNGFNFWG